MRQQQYYYPPAPAANSNYAPYQMNYSNQYEQPQMQQQYQPQVIVVQKEDVYVEQQQQPQGSSEFMQPLCGCTKNCCICLATFCIPFAGNYFHAVAVERATKGRHNCVASCFLDCCYCCCLNRGIIRNNYNIDGEFCSDCCIMYWCQPCATLQDYYEVELRENY